MKKTAIAILLLYLLVCFVGCSAKEKSESNTPAADSSISTQEQPQSNMEENSVQTKPVSEPYTKNTRIADVINDSAFGDYGRLIFPVNNRYYSGDTLGDLSLTWYSHIDADKTVEIANYFKSHAEAGDIIFYDIYTEAEKAADPAKADTGLFFFKGNPGERFAICNAGGGFAYVGAMHDSFPHALELSKKGYNAFALIYRPGWDTAVEDLARAIGFIFEHAEELEVDTDCYSLWGGSAGGRMTAYLGSYGPAAFGGDDLQDREQQLFSTRDTANILKTIRLHTVVLEIMMVLPATILCKVG